MSVSPPLVIINHSYTLVHRVWALAVSYAWMHSLVYGCCHLPTTTKHSNTTSVCHQLQTVMGRTQLTTLMSQLPLCKIISAAHQVKQNSGLRIPAIHLWTAGHGFTYGQFAL